MQKVQVNLNVNDRDYSLWIYPNVSLLDALRNELDLTGTKCGCGEGECGACTVHVDGKSVLSCLALAVACQGKKVKTVEGLAQKGDLHPVQQAFVDHGAIACGFCTPGMVMSAVDFLAENASPTEQEIREGMRGNLCRCTGYTKIVEAIQQAAPKMASVGV